MEDQFGGRTDDDLFYDDFEPAEAESTPEHHQARVVETTSAPEPNDNHIATPKPAEAVHRPVKTLANSIYADQTLPSTQAGSDSGLAGTSANASTTDTSTNTTSTPPAAGTQQDQRVPPPTNAPAAPREKKRGPSGVNASSDPTARLQSGANPRQKPTEDELAAKMEKMKLLSAEKTRKFEMAEKDEKQHAQAYAKGMEEARRRRADEADRRRRGEEDRRKLEDERAKNRERKLKAIGMKEGGWDEGKEAISEEEARRGFRGANGGIRGARSSGLAGSRYARDGEDVPDVDRFLDDDRFRGRGRGRGGRGRGRGRGGGRDASDPSSAGPRAARQAAPQAEDFPALPAGQMKQGESSTPAIAKPPEWQAKKAASSATSVPAPPPPPLTPPTGGKWDDEMEALDAAKQK